MGRKKVFLILISVVTVCLTACGNSQPKSTLEFIEGRLVTINETEYVGVFFNFTNNTGETVMPADEIDVKAFQNGTELNVIVYSGEEVEDAIQCDTSIQTGTTAKVVWTFDTQDDSKVSVECSDGQKFDFEIE